ncbi:MAG TPA: winged helix-turn-helix domain-containing protein [bacterium]|nr:winged helix-turn-helix domain-containing protein [bacterium]
MTSELELSREKALLDPTRLKMVLHLSIPRTVKQVADRLGVSYRRLYHHMQVLEKAGIVEQVNVPYRRSVAERYYRVREDQLLVSPQQSGASLSDTQVLAQQLSTTTCNELTAALQAHQHFQLRVARFEVHCGPEERHGLLQKIEAILLEAEQQIRDLDDPNGSSTLVNFHLTFESPVGGESRSNGRHR